MGSSVPLSGGGRQLLELLGDRRGELCIVLAVPGLDGGLEQPHLYREPSDSDGPRRADRFIRGDVARPGGPLDRGPRRR